jgi:guanylate kinase
VLEENGQSYWFTDPETMDDDIKHSKFLEYGEYNGHLYGTHLDAIRDVIKQVSSLFDYLGRVSKKIYFQGKMCVLDCSPMALKILHNSSEFLPYVIFIAAPGMEQLKNLYDVGKSNSNLRYSSRNLTVSVTLCKQKCAWVKHYFYLKSHEILEIVSESRFRVPVFVLCQFYCENVPLRSLFLLHEV